MSKRRSSSAIISRIASSARSSALRSAGADVWYDEHNLNSGELGPTIEHGLQQRPIFVIVFSPAALNSRWVQDEARWAHILLREDPARVILPVVVQPILEENIWLFMRDFKRVEGPSVSPHPLDITINQLLRRSH